MIAYLKTRLAILRNRLRRRRGPAIQDQCAKLIMHMCSLQLERGETREVAPTLGAVGPVVLSGGAITSVLYHVFDTEADKVDKSIKQEPWRAFAKVTMLVTIESDPQFTVHVDGKSVEPRACHRSPGLELVGRLSAYFPLLPRVYTGPVFKPVETA